MKVIISHPNWPEHVNRAAGVLEKLNLLDSFWTTIAFPYKFFFFKKRYFSEVSFSKIKIHFLKEFFRNIFKVFKVKKLYFFDDSFFSINSIYKGLDLKVSRYLKSNIKNINIVYGYQNCTLNSFRIAKDSGIKTIYDLLSPYWKLRKTIMEDEIKFQPEWRLSQMEILSTKKCLEEEEEIFLSDQIIAASSFAMKSLVHFNKKNLNIKIISYGAPNRIVASVNRRKNNEKLKIIFAGRLILSKGIQYLISSLESIDIPWEVQIAGSVLEKPEEISKKLLIFLKDPRCKFLGQISNDKLMMAMKNSHVFILPSLYEGFGLTLLEAMACGLPVITTENTAGPDFIKNTENGFITPIRDTKITADILRRIYENEGFRLSISEMALSTSSHYSWKRYSDQLSNIFI
jgi:glycosyltransferase involved in cell wall biosynthesis